MKKYLKKHSRKGFTLVETILSIFILFVISTMLINGFIATMAYSYQTSIYSKSGSDNYSVCMKEVSDWSNQTVENREKKAYGDYITGAGETKSLDFKSNGAHSVDLETLSVAFNKHDSLVNTVPMHLNYEDGRFAPSNSTTQFSDNRKAFFYYPEYCSKGTAEVGNIVVLYESKNKAYYWVVKKADLSTAEKVSATPIYTRTPVAESEEG